MLPQPRILLVEDTRDLAHVIVRELEAAGYQVVHTQDGESALRSVAQRAFQLLILDWMLPDINGLEVLRQLRATSSIPVLMLTARDAEIDRVLGLESGADDYLTKPFSMPELIARVRAMLRRRVLIEETLRTDQQHGGEILTTGDLSVNPTTHSAHLGTTEIDLTRREFDLLYLLVSNPGRVFSRAYLLDTVWSADYVEGDRAVDNTVLRLRKKLDAHSEQIETVWGVGYRWKRS
jgi:DNA-binding response OmpR family regulator